MKEKSKILVVDDTHTNIEILLELLSDKYDVMVAMDGETAIEIAIENNPNLILLDILMPGMNGYDVCKILKSLESTKDIPIIFITAKMDEDSIEKAYDIGGIDYVTKPFKPKELLARVKTQLDMKTLINNLEYMSSFDAMTGVLNRRKFFELGEKKFIEKSDNLHAIMIDIDKFKKINDKHGHPIGDKVIKLVANTIKKKLFKDSIFGRIGGEEFAILLNCSSIDCITTNIEAIRTSIESMNIENDNGTYIKVTISQGISKVNKNIDSLDKLLKIADDTLYEAKGEGRNRIIFRI